MKKKKFRDIGKTCLSVMIASAAILAGSQAVAQVPKSEMSDTAPPSYVVKKGDTLWAISGVFLKNPWKWPQVWGMNKSSIKNPHLIFPGEIIIMSEKSGMVTLNIGVSGFVGSDDGTIRLSPSVREEAGDAGYIKALPASAIAPFVDRSLVLDSLDLLDGPTIISAQEGRINLGTGSVAYVDSTDVALGTKYSIYRPGSALSDPDTGAPLGYEVNSLGTARVVRVASSARPAKIQIVSATKEVSIGDRLVELKDKTPDHYIPHAPALAISGKILAIHGNLGSSVSKNKISGYEIEGGSLSVIILNKGAADGIEEGHTFALLNGGKKIEPRHTFGFRNGDSVSSKITVLPEEENGMAMVFRTFEKVSYAIVLNGEMPVKVGDRFEQP